RSAEIGRDAARASAGQRLAEKQRHVRPWRNDQNDRRHRVGEKDVEIGQEGHDRLAKSSACSSRSLPQNNSPLATKLGAPKMPSRCASSVLARSLLLISSDCARASAALPSWPSDCTISAITVASPMLRLSANSAR